MRHGYLGATTASWTVCVTSLRTLIPMTPRDLSPSPYSKYAEVDIVLQFRGEAARRIIDVPSRDRKDGGSSALKLQERVVQALRALNLIIADRLPTRWDLQWKHGMVRAGWSLVRYGVSDVTSELTNAIKLECRQDDYRMLKYLVEMASRHLASTMARFEMYVPRANRVSHACAADVLFY